MNFSVAILILKMEGKKQHFWHIMLYCLKKSENATETKKGLLQCVEIVKNGFWSFVLKISLWMMVHGWVDQLKLIEIILRLWEESVLIPHER